jgi:hypothetical protein
MEEFYTPETYYAMSMAEFEAEQEWERLEAFDPYADDYDGDDDEYYEGNEDAGMEGYLFGWDA